ncbi:hypothetical protein [Halobacillus halophilus]|uniref:hypothetical protein n=1 Tax=Halobacillus halophilus TaxID=1570 RepID=UPI001CD3EF25|nr:hypothetical protein [Halobacillus halophilus]MCA1010574.1 hypothetical protein [Halobacillus halophilus]
MWAICSRECIDLFKGFKAVLIISILIGMSFASTKLGSAFPGQAAGISQKDALVLTFTLFGILFVFALSHSVLKRNGKNTPY